MSRNEFHETKKNCLLCFSAWLFRSETRERGESKGARAQRFSELTQFEVIRFFDHFICPKIPHAKIIKHGSSVVRVSFKRHLLNDICYVLNFLHGFQTVGLSAFAWSFVHLGGLIGGKNLGRSHEVTAISPKKQERSKDYGCNYSSRA